MPKPKGKHSVLAGETATDLNLAIRRQNLPYVVPKECAAVPERDAHCFADIASAEFDCEPAFWGGAFNAKPATLALRVWPSVPGGSQTTANNLTAVFNSGF